MINMIADVECRSIYGGTKLVSKEKLLFRPSVYALIVYESRILLLNSRSANRLALPGGGVEIGEPLAMALKREVQEETGLNVEVGEFLHFEEEFFYYDPTDIAFHSFRFIFACRPLTFELIKDDEVDDEEGEKPRWYSVHKLNKAELQSFGDFIMDYLNQIKLENI